MMMVPMWGKYLNSSLNGDDSDVDDCLEQFKDINAAPEYFRKRENCLRANLGWD